MDKNKPRRFRLARSDDAGWVTIDVFTGKLVTIDQNLITMMDRAGFDDVVEFLNDTNASFLDVVAKHHGSGDLFTSMTELSFLNTPK